MRPYGGDRCREVQGRRVIHSRIAKGWTPRTPATLVHAEFPGTAVLWDDEYFEVVDAAPLDYGGVRYVLLPWRDDHTIRTFEAYDALSEQKRLADYELAMRQRKASSASRWSGVVLGHLPAVVQEDLQNRLGVYPSRLTLISTIPPIVLFGLAVFLAVGRFMGHSQRALPAWLLIALAAMTVESIFRMTIALSTSRGAGSVLGYFVYTIWWLVTGRRGVSPFTARGESIRFTPPPAEIAARDTFEVIEPLITLLPVPEQQRFAERWGFDYRRHATAVAAVILAFAAIGTFTSWSRWSGSGSFTAVVSAMIAAAIAIEQIVRLRAFQRGPAGSVLGHLVHLIARKILRSLLTAPEPPAAA